MVRKDPKLPNDNGEVPKTKMSGWQFDSQLWILLSTWHENYIDYLIFCAWYYSELHSVIIIQWACKISPNKVIYVL